MKHILATSLLLLTLTASAQERQPAAPMQRPNAQLRQNWNQGQFRAPQQQPQLQPQQQNPMLNRSGQFSPAEYWKQQKTFFTERAGLTEDEANVFFPLYNELQQKKREINREIRRTMRQDSANAQPTEEQCLKAIDARAEASIKIAELEKEYLKKFKEVLPASKILKVQNAEEQFNSQILKDIQQTRGHQFIQQNQQPGRQPGNWQRQRQND